MANEICEKCGAALNGAQFCPSCGTAAVQVQTQPRPQPTPVPPPPPAQPVYTAAPPPVDVKPPKGGRYSVMGIGSFMGSLFLLSLPIAGFIIMIVWACGGCQNENKRNLARAMLIWMGISIVVSIAVFIILAAYGISVLDQWQSMTGTYL